MPSGEGGAFLGRSEGGNAESTRRYEKPPRGGLDGKTPAKDLLTKTPPPLDILNFQDILKLQETLC
jgi:hypothetical protein